VNYRCTFLALIAAVIWIPGGCSDSAKSGDGESTEQGTTDEGTTDEGTTDEGTTDEGTTDEGTTDEGTTTGDDCPSDVFLDVSKAPGSAVSGVAAPSLSVSCTDEHIVIQTNNVPHYTFIQTTPNPLVAADKTIQIPRAPVWLDEPVDIPFLGLTAVAINGCSIFGPNEGQVPDSFGDPIANDIMDPCLGHTAFEYHYHALKQKCLMPAGLVAEPWLNEEIDTTAPSPILGYALDGYPIYGSYGRLEEGGEVVKFLSSWERTDATDVGCASSSECTNKNKCALVTLDGAEVKACISHTYAWDNNQCTKASCDNGDGVYLDKCNGRFGPDGKYRYHATDTFPYVNGCYHGVAESGNGGPGRGGTGGGPGDGTADGGTTGGGTGGGPPACEQQSDCDGACPEDAQGCTCHQTPQGNKICVPTCDEDADCPDPPSVTLICNNNNFCVPQGGPGGGGGGGGNQ
jgi:hypothetical protein